jgi:hypothetical protein
MDADNLYFTFGQAMMARFKEVSPTLDLNERREKLARPDYYWLMLWYTRGLAETCGSFADAVYSLRDEADHIAAAYQHFGFPKTAAAVHPSIELWSQLDECDVMEADRSPIDALDGQGDFSYEALIEHLRRNRSVYGVDFADVDE